MNKQGRKYSGSITFMDQSLLSFSEGAERGILQKGIPFIFSQLQIDDLLDKGVITESEANMLRELNKELNYNSKDITYELRDNRLLILAFMILLLK